MPQASHRRVWQRAWGSSGASHSACQTSTAWVPVQSQPQCPTLQGPQNSSNTLEPDNLNEGPVVRARAPSR